MTLFIPPKYQMRLINEVNQAIWAAYSSYVQVRYYMKKWLNDYEIQEKQGGNIDLMKTLHSLSCEILIEIAIDLGL